MWYVEIVAREDDQVVKRMGPVVERQADKLKAGAEINLNHDDFFVRTVKEAEPVAAKKTRAR